MNCVFAEVHALRYKQVQWHPNRDGYIAQQFLAGYWPVSQWHNYYSGHYHNYYFSFAEMRPYLDQTVRIKKTLIYLDDGITYNPERIEEMESIAHVWCDRNISITKECRRIVADDFELILNSPTILKCQLLFMSGAHFSFKDYKVLYNAKIIENSYYGEETDPKNWPEFLEQPGVKPLVVLRKFSPESINNVLDHLSKSFSTAVSPNAFKIVFAAESYEALTAFQKTNDTSGEKLELKKGLPTEYQNEYLNRYFAYTLERYSI